MLATKKGISSHCQFRLVEGMILDDISVFHAACLYNLLSDVFDKMALMVHEMSNSYFVGVASMRECEGGMI